MLARHDGKVIASWLERRPDEGYRFRASIGDGQQWGLPFTIDDSPDIKMFTVDLPGIAELSGGGLLAYWQRSDPSAPDDDEATTIRIARSSDDGASWTPLPSPHAGGNSGQHSFLSAFPAGPDLGLVWLDAQSVHHVKPGAGSEEMLGAIGLRYALFDKDGEQTANAFIDPITCECCPTSAVATSKGPVVVYRNRMAAEGVRPEDVQADAPAVRDIYLTRLENGKWTEPKRVYADNWVINACPVNGPAVDASGANVAVAWWTARGRGPHVSVAFSTDAGTTFGNPVEVSTGAAEGQVTVALTGNGDSAIVGWLEDNKTWARSIDASGHAGPAIALGPGANRARLPRWLGNKEGALAVWNELSGNERVVKMARIIK
jgi:hypothetical protein